MDSMRGQRALETLGALVDVDLRGLAGMDTVALRKLSEQNTLVQSWCAAFEVQIASAAAAQTCAGRPVDPEPVISGGGRKSQREAVAAAERARACATVAGAAEALAAGELGTAHVDALAAVTRSMSDAGKERFGRHAAKLLEHGQYETPEEFARRCKQLAGEVIDEAERLARQERCRRQRKVTRWNDPDGMCHTKLSLDPLADAQVWALVNQAMDAQRGTSGGGGDGLGELSGDEPTFDRRRADVLFDLITRPGGINNLDGVGGSGGHTTGGGAEVSVVIDLDSLLGRASEGSVPVAETSGGQPLPVETIRRLCCNGKMLPVVLNGDGLPTDVGRAQRLATRAQRQALQVLYATCAIPGCQVPFDRCEIHHVTFWDGDHGATDLNNLVPGCTRHHHMIHEGGWTLTMTPDRIITWHPPDGTILFHGDSRNRWITNSPNTDSGTGASSDRAGGTSNHGASGTSNRGAGRVAAGIDENALNEHAGRIFHDFIARRRHDTTETADAAATQQQRRRDTPEPLPLFGTDDAIQHRGPPRAS